MITTCSPNGHRETDRQTAIFNCEISTLWETNPRTTPQRNSGLLMGPEQGTRYKTLQSIWWWWFFRSSLLSWWAARDLYLWLKNYDVCCASVPHIQQTPTHPEQI